MTKTNGKNGKKTIKLALQGGGAHGAFTWGVLDQLLADGRIEIEAVSGASAGAMNAVILADGLADGGPEAARKQLNEFWKGISLDGDVPEVARGTLDAMFKVWGMALDANPMVSYLKQNTSPYQFNPFDINPLRDILIKKVDFARLRAHSPVRLYISATNVETGKGVLFKDHELTVDHVLASACLPALFKTVMIDGTPYWDGGFAGNPPLYPLYPGRCDDIMLVQINPSVRKGVPRTHAEIQDRINEIAFNTPMMLEMRAIEFVARLLDNGVLEAENYKRVRMHRIAMAETVHESAATKMSTDLAFLTSLKSAGQSACEAWLERHFDAIGQHSTMDIRKEFS